MTITKNELWDAAIKKLKASRKETKIVENEEEAKAFTESDPAGYKWSVGEAYYTIIAPLEKSED